MKINKLKIIKKNTAYFLNLTNETQTSPAGRPLRLSSISKNLQMPEKYINRIWKNHWFYKFRFLDTDAEFITFEFDYFDNYVCTIKK